MLMTIQNGLHLVDEIIPEYDVVFSNDDFTHELYSKRGKSIISVELKIS